MNVSLPEAYRTVKIPKTAGNLRRFLAFAGPAYLVSVGYMDPGNWATDLKGGSMYGYALLWVILASNLMAQLLQVLCARLGLVTGKDLAQACRAYYKKPAAIALWFLCEIAIIACDLAEVVGSAIAINLLSGGRIPIIAGVLITGADVLILLFLLRYGFRLLEAIVICLVATIAVCFAMEMFFSQPDIVGIGKGLITPSFPGKEALFISLGILGATVMPHNLYLHSSVVQTRDFERTESGLKQAIKSNTLDTIIALSAAFFVNAAILILAAAVFHKVGTVVDDMRDAHNLLGSSMGAASAILFAVALLCSGQASTITGTLAGQIVMEGFLNIRIAPWLRRLITRMLAIVPAVIIIWIAGENSTVDLLVWSQVILSMQLSFAIFPLLFFTSDKKKMGKHANSPLVIAIAGVVCTLIAGLNIKFLGDEYGYDKVAIGGLVVALFAAWVMFVYKGKPKPEEPAVS